jgi:hypothetical protein
MADSYKRIYQGQLATASGVVYTVPSGTQAIIKSIRVVNTSATATTVKLWNGGSADSNVILPPTSIDAGGFAEFDGTLTLAAADTIAAQAGAATSLTMTIHGLELT